MDTSRQNKYKIPKLYEKCRTFALLSETYFDLKDLAYYIV